MGTKCDMVPNRSSKKVIIVAVIEIKINLYLPTALLH